jgi:translocation and assembly module TamB
VLPRTHAAFKGRPELGRVLAWICLAVLTLVGGVAVAVPFLFGSAAIRGRIERAVAAAVKDETNLDVSLRIERALWPPGILVRDLQVASRTPGRPFARVGEARVTVRPFALLSGRVVLDGIELVAPDVDAELEDGALANLPLKLAPHPPKAKARDVEPPFRLIAVTGAKVKLSHRQEGKQLVALDLSGVDLDLDVGGDATPVYDLRLHKASGRVRTTHAQANAWPLPDRFSAASKAPFPAFTMVDDDALCALSIAARLSDAPRGYDLSLKRVELDARIDDDAAEGPAPSCAPGATRDDRVVSLRIDGVEIDIPKQPERAEPGRQPSTIVALGTAGGRLRARAPAFLAYRYVPLDPVDGWVSLQLDAFGTIDLDDPLAGILQASAKGSLEAHDLRYASSRFGTLLHGDVSIKPPLTIASNKLEVDYGEGQAVITDFELKAAPTPLAKKKLPMKASLAVKDLPFPGLIRELAVARAAHVRWDFKEAKAQLSGYLDPLQLDGDIKANTRNFELGEGPIEQPNHGHIIGLAPKTGGIADLDAKVVVRGDYLAFEQIHAAFGSTKLDGRVLLGFHDQLEIDVKGTEVDLADASPLATFALGGVGKLDLKMRGTYSRFKAEGSAAMAGFLFDQFMLGDVEKASYVFDETSRIEVTALEARHGSSRYSVPSMRIDLGVPHGVVVDALTKSDDASLDDLYEILKMKGDPRWDEIRGHVAMDARAHFVVGGKEDPCGKGRLDLDVTGRALALDLFGERYDGGTADASLTWWDFDGGGLGMDMDLHAATLHKKGGGTALVSGSVRKGGHLNMKATASGVSLRSLSALPAMNVPVDGAVDAVAEIGGTFDAMRIVADVNVSPVQIEGFTLPRSRLRVVREPLATLPPPPPSSPKGCYDKKDVKPFDAVAWAADLADGEFVISGNMFGKAILLDGFRVTDQRKRVARGKVAIRHLDLAPLSLLRPENAELVLEGKEEAPAIPVSGFASADVTLYHHPISEWWNSQGKVEGITIDAARGDVSIATVKPTPTLTFGKEGVSLPKTVLSLKFGDEPTKVEVGASLKRFADDEKPPQLAASIELPSVPLARLEEFMPKVIDRAEGFATASLSVTGPIAIGPRDDKFAGLSWEGALTITKGAFSFKQLGTPLVGVNGTIKVDPKKGVSIEKLHGELGGGAIDATGAVALKGASLGEADLRFSMQGVHLRQGDGVSMTFDSDLRVTWAPPEPGESAEPARVEGVVDVESFLYEKQIKIFDVSAIQAAKRTEVENYDPDRDLVRWDIEIRNKLGFRAKNNLVDASASIGPSGLRIVGTNQRWGLVGELSVNKGGIFKLRRNDFEIREGSMRFEDETKIDPIIDLSAVTEFRRAAAAGSTAEWRIKMHVYGTREELKMDLTSEPNLSQEDLIYLLTIGMTKAESLQVGGSVAGGVGLDLIANVTGVNETLSQAIPVIDEFRFGSAYSLRTGRTEPQVTFGKKLSDALRASVTQGFGERREIQANIEWRLMKGFSLMGSYDNVNDVSSQGLGNFGFDLRYRLEFE